ncbi:hypothetical protein L3X38_031052 [Prunus dulcis]|uniref:Uncharacterized protein n=1 Tax=Prunus dulcis TaxID=3755 RepID=A0AAD4VBI8_PRUDU|nr:hypothetical protein L3X38_031052 [Prunus dulcis]
MKFQNSFTIRASPAQDQNREKGPLGEPNSAPAREKQPRQAQGQVPPGLQPEFCDVSARCHTPDRLRRSMILSALGLATFSPARTVLFLGAHEATSQGGHPSWDCSSLPLA